MQKVNDKRIFGADNEEQAFQLHESWNANRNKCPLCGGLVKNR